MTCWLARKRGSSADGSAANWLLSSSAAGGSGPCWLRQVAAHRKEGSSSGALPPLPCPPCLALPALRVQGRPPLLTAQGMQPVQAAERTFFLDHEHMQHITQDPTNYRLQVRLGQWKALLMW